VTAEVKRIVNAFNERLLSTGHSYRAAGPRHKPPPRRAKGS